MMPAGVRPLSPGSAADHDSDLWCCFLRLASDCEFYVCVY